MSICDMLVGMLHRSALFKPLAAFPQTRAAAATHTGGVPPPLTQLFSVGQYVRCVIQQLSGGPSDEGSSKKRITATLRLKALLSGVSTSTAAAVVSSKEGYIAAGQVIPAVVTSVEDRGYALSFGVKVGVRSMAV